MPADDVTITWLGHATTRIESAGKSILIDPFLQDNPAVPADAKTVDSLDLMLITHGHFDHMADAIPIAQATGADVIAIFEIAQYLMGQNVKNVTDMNKGGTVTWNGIEITMVHAVHSSGITHNDQILYGGTPAGYILRFPNRFTVYHAGDTDVFGDMEAIGRRYAPDLALLPIGGHYTMGPRGAAEATRLLGVKNIIPIHYGTWPPLAGTPDQLRQAAKDVQGLKVIALQPGQSVTQSQVTGGTA